MPCYHTHIHSAHLDAFDDEGQKFPDLPAARVAALRGIRDIIGNEAQQGRIDFRGRIEIADCGGEVLDSIPFLEAFEVLGLTDT